MVKTDWFKRKREKGLDEKTDLEKFTDLMEFLIDFKYIAKDGIAEYERAKATNAKSYTALVTGQCMTISTKAASQKKPYNKTNIDVKDLGADYCIACQDGATDLSVAKHSTFTCDHWQNLSLADRKKLVKCEYHPRTSNHSTKDCKFKKPRGPCRHCKAATHHTLFCPVHKTTSNLTFTASTYVTDLPEVSSSLQSPVLLPFMFANVRKPVTSVLDSNSVFIRVGALTDNCATDNWITFAAADKLGLVGSRISISAGGFGGKREMIKSMLFTVDIRTKDGIEQIECLGVEQIGSDEVLPDRGKYLALCKKFKINQKEVSRPEHIDMLLGQRANHLHPEIVIRSIDGMKLIDGPLGKTFAGVDHSRTLGGSQLSSNFYTSAVLHHPVIAVSQDQLKSNSCTEDPLSYLIEGEATVLTKSLLCNASRDFLNYFKEENIGADCNPRCGNCICGSCSLDGKSMSIKEEKEYELIRSNLQYDAVGTVDDPGPFWRSSLPWTLDRRNLGNNRSVVLGTLNATLRKLNKDPAWRQCYEDQLKVLLDQGFARKVSQEELDSWVNSGKKAYYISHQCVVVPENKSTPIRVVFNSSQKFLGKSLNSCLALGPETMNNLQGIMLRFREHKVAAAGNIRKMF